MPFDIGFVELCTILVVSLIVLGPDKLPVAARTLTRYFRTFSRTINSFKSEVDRELQMDELKRQIQHQKQQMADVVNNTNGINPSEKVFIGNTDSEHSDQKSA